MKILLPAVLFMAACSSHKIARDPSKIVAPYKDGKFENLEPFEDKSFWNVLKMIFGSGRVTWPPKGETPFFKPLATRSDALIVTVINHATVLIQMDGVNFLTDPLYSDRASPFSFAGPKRGRDPGIKLEDLPPIDYVLISHNHYDHLDLETLKILRDKHDPKFFAGLGDDTLLKENGITNVVGLDWWEESATGPLKIQYVPAHHWSARGLFDKWDCLWGGYYVKGSKTVYFAGDTGYAGFFKLLKERLGSPDVALLPIGAYEPRWFMKPAHMNPEEAVQASLDLGARQSIGIHYGTFQLTYEGIDAPPLALTEALRAKGIDAARFIAPEFGRAYRP